MRTIVLVGFMASGKTTIGRRLARRLGWSFIDLDAEIEKYAGATVAAIFRERGETGFREIERELTPTLVHRHDSVLATGGGWAAQPGTLEALPDTALSVWLAISPEESVRRATRSRTERPLLRVGDPLARARTLLEERSASYGRADIRIDVDGLEPDRVVEKIVKLMGGSEG